MMAEVVRRELFDFCWDVHVDGYTSIKTRAVKNRPPLARPARPEGDAGQDLHELDEERSRPALFITSGLPLEAQGFKLRRYAPLAGTDCSGSSQGRHLQQRESWHSRTSMASSAGGSRPRSILTGKPVAPPLWVNR